MVGRQDGNTLHHGLRDQHAVERVAVMQGQSAGGQGVGELHRQDCQPLPFDRRFDEACRVNPEFQPAAL